MPAVHSDERYSSSGSDAHEKNQETGDERSHLSDSSSHSEQLARRHSGLARRRGPEPPFRATKEIEERALLDGATRLQMLRQVVIPVVLPGILTAAIFALTLSFQEYIYGLTFISSMVNRTIPVGISVEMVRGDVYFWGPLMASSIIGSIPVVNVYALSLDYFISRMTTGAVK